MKIDSNRLVISALKGGSGKTILSIGIVSALREKGFDVTAFKKGPDYIDAGWLALASGKNCYSLDTFLMDQSAAYNSFVKNQTEISIIEGNRGLYDGIDIDGNTSTSEIAKMLKSPVILCLDCTKSTRTVAATVLGCLHFDKDVKIEGVVLNRYAGPRHRNIVTKNIEYHTGVKVIGAIPKLGEDSFPERHMGLVPMDEHKWALDSVNKAKKMAFDNIDIDKIVEIAKTAESIDDIQTSEKIEVIGAKPVIGVIRDSAFQFYYPENIEILKKNGADVKFISALKDRNLSGIDALYIGGGFPETHAKELNENISFRNEVKKFAEIGMPIYAECGGLMFLGKEIIVKGNSFEMTDVFPISFTVEKKPQGHGYVIARVTKENPYYKTDEILKGHEFRYSNIIEWRGEKNTAFTMERGTGMAEKSDGVFYKNVLATYTHTHALGNPGWVKSMIKLAREFSHSRKDL